MNLRYFFSELIFIFVELLDAFSYNIAEGT